MVSLVRLAVVALLIGLIYLICLSRLVRWLLARWRGAGEANPAAHKRSRLRRASRWTVWLLAGLFPLAAAWAYIEPYRPVIEHVRVASKKITAPIRLVQLSDLHSEAEVRAEPAVVELVRSLAPDLILFTGDGVSSDGGIPVFRRTMRQLADIAPLYGVRGNWEVWWFTHLDTFADTGMQELTSRALRVEVRGQRLWVGGGAVDSEHLLRPMLDAIDAEERGKQPAFRLMLHHYPAAWQQVAGRADLLLSGDTHGGQIALPLLGPLIRIARRDGVFYHSGLQRRGDLALYVNRGIGMEGGAAPRVRFNCRPEVTLIELTPQ